MGSIVAGIVATLVGAVLAGATAVTAVNVAAPQFTSDVVESQPADGQQGGDGSQQVESFVPYGNR